MLCTAWPLAPLTMLSSALITMSRPVRGSSRHAISQDVRADDIFRVRQRLAFEQTDERLIDVSCLVAGGNFFGESGLSGRVIEKCLPARDKASSKCRDSPESNAA